MIQAIRKWRQARARAKECRPYHTQPPGRDESVTFQGEIAPEDQSYWPQVGGVPVRTAALSGGRHLCPMTPAGFPQQTTVPAMSLSRPHAAPPVDRLCSASTRASRQTMTAAGAATPGASTAARDSSSWSMSESEDSANG